MRKMISICEMNKRILEYKNYKKIFYTILLTLEFCFLIACLKSSANSSYKKEEFNRSTLKEISETTEIISPTLFPTLLPTPEPTVTPTPTLEPRPTLTPFPAKRVEREVEESTRAVYSVIWGNKGKAEVALTFDDGYDGAALAAVLDTLKRSQIKCSFFIIGDELRRHSDLFKKAVADGHQICNHTKTHKYLTESMSDQAIRDELTGWENAVTTVLGEEYLKKMKAEFPYMRFPGGNGASNERILKVITETGYIPIGWSDETVYSVLRHYNLNNASIIPIAEKIAEHIAGETRNGSIILFHFNAYDAGSLGETIKKVLDKGLSFKLVSEILSS